MKIEKQVAVDIVCKVMEILQRRQMLFAVPEETTRSVHNQCATEVFSILRKAEPREVSPAYTNINDTDGGFSSGRATHDMKG